MLGVGLGERRGPSALAVTLQAQAAEAQRQSTSFLLLEPGPKLLQVFVECLFLWESAPLSSPFPASLLAPIQGGGHIPGLQVSCLSQSQEPAPADMPRFAVFGLASKSNTEHCRGW